MTVWVLCKNIGVEQREVIAIFDDVNKALHAASPNMQPNYIDKHWLHGENVRWANNDHTIMRFDVQ